MLKLVPLDPTLKPFLKDYLLKGRANASSDDLPFILLTYAQSLDSRISIKPGVQTKISSLQTKTMTHYIRSKFQGILVGIGTFLADNPSLNCRYVEDESTGKTNKISPVIIDPSFKSREKLAGSTIVKKYAEGTGAQPIFVLSKSIEQDKATKDTVGELQGNVKFVYVQTHEDKFTGRRTLKWEELFKLLKKEAGLSSVMVEGGAVIINDLLTATKEQSKEPLIDSLVVTIGLVFLGKNGVQVSPERDLHLTDVTWWNCEEGDSVIAARLK